MSYQDSGSGASEIELLAEEISAQCTGSVMMGEEIVAVMDAGRPRRMASISRVGTRVPYVAPFGAPFAAYADFATGLLAILALLTIRVRPLFWLFVVAFNVVGATDFLLDYYHAIQVGLPAVAGELGAVYAIPILYVPLLMITHVVALYWLVPWPGRQAQAVA